MNKIRFISEEQGVSYLVTNYKYKDGALFFKAAGCWKFPVGKKPKPKFPVVTV